MPEVTGSRPDRAMPVGFSSSSRAPPVPERRETLKQLNERFQPRGFETAPAASPPPGHFSLLVAVTDLAARVAAPKTRRDGLPGRPVTAPPPPAAESRRCAAPLPSPPPQLAGRPGGGRAAAPSLPATGHPAAAPSLPAPAATRPFPRRTCPEGREPRRARALLL